MRGVLLFFLSVWVLLSVQAQDAKTVSFVFIGDVMGHGPQIRSAYDSISGRYDYSDCFKYVSNVFDDADFTIANLEVTLAGSPYMGYPQFSSPDQLAVDMKNAGVDVMMNANNHCLDRHKHGLERTIHVLDSLNIPHSGTYINQEDKEKRPFVVLEKNGIKVVLLNYTYGTNGIEVSKPNVVNYIDDKVIEDDIQKARKLHPDKIIAFVHWGVEYQTMQNKEQERVNKLFSDNGVDIVIGSHPHVIEPIYNTQNHFVAYSLGNFVSNQRKAPTDGGVMVRIELSKNGDKTVLSNAGYYLTWVYIPEVNHKKHYYVLPVSGFEKDKLFLPDNSYSRLREYAKEARDIYRSNINISEYTFDKNKPGWVTE